MKIHQEYLDKQCDKKGNQPLNLSYNQRAALFTLKKKVREGDLVILNTDKTGKLAAVSKDTYKQMGMKHTAGDQVITRGEAAQIQRELNGHVSMFNQMTGLGKDWGQVDRMRETLINQSALVPPLYLTVKDHKTVAEGEVPSTRPVVSGGRGMNIHLNNILGEILEPVAAAMEGSDEVISSEQLLNLIDTANSDEKINDDSIELTAYDAKALYPSLDTNITAKAVREEVLKSPVQFEGLNSKEMARYLAANQTRGNKKHGECMTSSQRGGTLRDRYHPSPPRRRWERRRGTWSSGSSQTSTQQKQTPGDYWQQYVRWG